MKATDKIQSTEKFQSVSIKNSSTQIKFCEQLWAVASDVSNERVATKKIIFCKQLWALASKGQAMKGLQLIASSYGLQHQKSEQWRVTAKQNREQLWTAASKGWAMRGLQPIVSRIKQRNWETNLIAGLRAPLKVQMGQGKYQFFLIESHMILWKIWSKKWQIWLSGAIPKKSMLWVHHRIRRIKNQTSDGEVIKKRKLRNQRENEENENDDVNGSRNGSENERIFILY